MSNVPLPDRIITMYVEGERGTYPIYKDGYTESQMHAHAAAVTAAKDAEIARLRAEMNLQPCGHPESLLLKSAETSEPLYCEACDDKSGRRDAEARETELMAANKALRAEVAGLREDAERYRILRRGQRWSVINGIGDTLRAEQLDAAIDAARKGEA